MTVHTIAVRHFRVYHVRGQLLLACSAAYGHQRAGICLYRDSIIQLLKGDTPGKVGGEPGDAFELVYSTVTDIVQDKVHVVDPVLAEYIRCVQPLAHFCHAQ